MKWSVSRASAGSAFGAGFLAGSRRRLPPSIEEPGGSVPFRSAGRDRGCRPRRHAAGRAQRFPAAGSGDAQAEPAGRPWRAVDRACVRAVGDRRQVAAPGRLARDRQPAGGERGRQHRGQGPDGTRPARDPRSPGPTAPKNSQTMSFPSGHAASAAAFATGVTPEKPGLAVPVIMLAAAVGASRVVTGVHYPSDVLAGFAVGTAAGAVTLRWVAAAPADPGRRPQAAAPGPRGFRRRKSRPRGQHVGKHGVAQAGRAATSGAAARREHRNERRAGPHGAVARGGKRSADPRGGGRRRQHAPSRWRQACRCW